LSRFCHHIVQLSGCFGTMIHGRYLILLLILMPLKSCVDPIPFTAENTGRVVISGTLTQENREHYVNVSLSNSFGGRPAPISGATVQVIGGDGSVGRYREIEPGRYALAPESLRVLIGQSYQVRVVLPNGKAYQSSPEQMPLPRSIETVRFEVNIRDESSAADVISESAFIDLFIDTELRTNGRQSYLRWDVEEAWNFQDLICSGLDKAEVCYYTAETPTITMPLFHSEDPNQEVLRNFKVFERRPFPTIQFNFRHYFSVRQYSISKEAYSYWEQINLVSNPQGTIFDVLPAAVTGNVRNIEDEDELVLGYFEVSSVSIARTSTLPEQLAPFEVFPTCSPFVPLTQENFGICCWCNTMDAPRIDRPEYWGE